MKEYGVTVARLETGGTSLRARFKSRYSFFDKRTTSINEREACVGTHNVSPRNGAMVARLVTGDAGSKPASSFYFFFAMRTRCRMKT